MQPAHIMKGLLRQHLLQTFGFWIPDWVCEVLDWLCEFRIGFARFWIASSLVTLDWVCEVLDCELFGDVGLGLRGFGLALRALW